MEAFSNVAVTKAQAQGASHGPAGHAVLTPGLQRRRAADASEQECGDADVPHMRLERELLAEQDDTARLVRYVNRSSKLIALEVASLESKTVSQRMVLRPGAMVWEPALNTELSIEIVTGEGWCGGAAGWWTREERTPVTWKVDAHGGARVYVDDGRKKGLLRLTVEHEDRAQPAAAVCGQAQAPKRAASPYKARSHQPRVPAHGNSESRLPAADAQRGQGGLREKVPASNPWAPGEEARGPMGMTFSLA